VAGILATQAEQQLVVVGTSAEVKMIQPVLEVADENLYRNVYLLVGKTTLPKLAAMIRHSETDMVN
jgi:hypothetical protein